MRVESAIVLVAMVAIAMANPQPVVVLGAAPTAAPETGFDYAGLEKVPAGPKPTNLVPATVVGVATHQGIPVVANVSAMARPRILNADGTEWGVPKVMVLGQTQQPGQQPQFVVAPVPETPTEKPIVFTSPPSNSNLPIPAVAPTTVSTILAPQLNLNDETKHRIRQEVNRLVELILHADATKQVKQAKKLRKNLRRILRKLVRHNVLRRTVTAAINMAKIDMKMNKKNGAKTTKKADKASAAVKKASAAVNKLDKKINKKSNIRSLKRALKKAEKSAQKAEKAVASAEKSIQKDAAKDAVATAAVAAASAAAPAPAPINMSDKSAAVNDAVNMIRAETQRAISQLRSELSNKVGSAPAANFVALGKKVEVLSKSALAFEKHFKTVDAKLKADSAAILGLNSRVDAIAKKSAKLEAAIATINKDIRAVTTKFNTLSRREQKLTIAAKAAIKSLASKVKRESKLVSKMLNTKSNFQRGVITSLAQLDENLKDLNVMSE